MIIPHTSARALAGVIGWLVLACSPVLAAGPGEQKAIAIAHDDPAIEWVACPDFLPEGCRIAVLHGDPAEPNADIFFKVPPGVTVPHHWHTSVERIVVVSGELHVTYDGQPTMVLQPGTYAYGPARLGHVAHCSDGDPCVLFIAFEEPIDAVPTGNASD